MYGALAVEGVGFNHPDAIPLKVASMVSQSYFFVTDYFVAYLL